jgi:hypothetical protein
MRSRATDTGESHSRMDTFTSTIEGKKVSLPLCPHETAVMEAATAAIDGAVASDDPQLINNVTKQLARVQFAVMHALQRAIATTRAMGDS